MGLFGKSKNKEEKEALRALERFDRKRNSKMATTVDPSRAIHELQPWQVNQEKPRQGLSNFSHKDIWGRDIKEPDLTNPTRDRWERPLDTIRAFQASIDRGYKDERSGGPPSQDARSFTGRDPYGRQGPNRNGDATPLSHRSTEDHHASFGAYNNANHMNETLVATAPVAQYGNRGSRGGPVHQPYADTGYAESLGRGNSSGTLDSDYTDGYGHQGQGQNYQHGGQGQSYNYGGGPSGYQQSPLQQEMRSETPRSVIKLSSGGGSGAGYAPEPQSKFESEKSEKKSWRKRFSKT
ncbi:hypothetical protein BZA77DRAFT_300992 [Pyronema omphalodes]|nr:hypothetical protein BZA77DRAFT_300992 [Pyronema omphalodes]